MIKISNAQIGQMMKTAADDLRALSAENQSLKTKVAQYEKRERAEKIASSMQSKGLEPETDLDTKVANLMEREDLDVVEEAVKIQAPQTKLASVVDGNVVQVEGDTSGDSAAANFAANLASI